MRSRLASLAGGMLAAAAIGLPARADTLSSPAFKITDIGIAETKGINNAGRAYGTASGRAFTVPTGQSATGGTTGTDTVDPKQPVSGLGDGYNIAYGVNPAGQVVGQLQVSTPDGTFLRPYIQTDGVTTQLPTLGGNYGGATAVNSFGQVVGSSQTADGVEHGFSYNSSTGQLTDVGTFGGRNSDARGINDAGQIVGSAQNTDGTWNAYVKSGEQMNSLGTLGGQNSWGFAINSSGTAIGSSETASGQTHAFLYKDGQMTDLGTLGVGSFASSVNSLGQVVGWNTGADNEYHAFLYSDGKMIDLNDYLPTDSPFAVLNGATGINDAGQIVGWGRLANGAQRSFLLTPTGPFPPAPIPEPTTLAFFGIVAAAGVAHRYRTRRAGTIRS